MIIFWSTTNVFWSTCIVHADFYSRAYVHRPPKLICKQSYANLLYGMMRNLVRVKVKLTLATMCRTPSTFTRSKCPCWARLDTQDNDYWCLLLFTAVSLVLRVYVTKYKDNPIIQIFFIDLMSIIRGFEKCN